MHKLSSLVGVVAALLFASGCAASPAAQSPAVVQSVPSGLATTPAPPSVAPAPVAASDPDSNLSTYLLLLGGNIPGAAVAMVEVPAPGSSLIQGTMCYIQYGGTATVLEDEGENVKAKYEYRAPQKDGVCPTGSILSIPRDKVDAAATKALDDILSVELDMVSVLSANRHHPVGLPAAAPQYGLIRSLNLYSPDKIIGFWFPCTLTSDVKGTINGSIIQVGTSPLGPIDEFIANGPTDVKQMQCPSETFFLEGDQMLGKPYITNLILK